MNFKLVFLFVFLTLILVSTSESSAQYTGEDGTQFSLEEKLGQGVGGRILNDAIGGGCLESDPNLCAQFALDCYPYTNQWSEETQSCEIWWNSAYVVFSILITIFAVIMIIIFIFLKQRKKWRQG
ncbi:MAG: hypothetical protein GKS07_08335 [Nitrosopumilus sp.]|nr:MAG: hypothetical protein GKS07_08335 [Nitrosopumilus sp.]